MVKHQKINKIIFYIRYLFPENIFTFKNGIQVINFDAVVFELFDFIGI